MLQFNNRDWSIFENLTEFKFSSFKNNEINSVIVEWSGQKYMSKICYIYDRNKLVWSWIVETFKFNKNENLSELALYPLIYDLRQDFVSDETGNVVYYNDSFENVLSNIVEQYRATVANPVLYMKTPINATGINVKYTFSYKTYLDAFNILLFTFLPMEKNIKIHPDWWIEIITSGNDIQMNYGDDVVRMEFTKKKDEIVNYIIFDNKIAGAGHILKTYQDTASITEHGKRVKYWDDGRVQYETTADQMVATYFSKYAQPSIEVQDITTTNLDVDIYDRITISNWEKDFSDQLFVTAVNYIKGWKKQIKVWTKLTRSILSRQEDSDSISAALEANIAWIPDLPAYIKETYIDSTEVRSPVIAGNSGYIANILKIWASGIVIDGVNAVIKTSNYNEASNIWWKIANDWSFHFAGNSSNYMKWNWSSLQIRGALSWGDITDKPTDITNPAYIQSTYIDQTEVRSPNITGTNGVFAWTLRVWTSWIVIDWPNKEIRSSNYNEGSNTWFRLQDSGNFHFWWNNSNFVKWNGSLLELRWLIKSTQYDFYGSTPWYAEGLLWAEQSALWWWRKVLWWYFWGDTSKQQVSMSRMQSAFSFDRSNSWTTYAIDTRFQPRMVIFNGFFENVGAGIFGTTNGQAWSVSFNSWNCSMYRSQSTIQATWVIGNLSINSIAWFPSMRNWPYYAQTGKLPTVIDGSGAVTNYIGDVTYPATSTGNGIYFYNCATSRYWNSYDIWWLNIDSWFSSSYLWSSHWSYNEATVSVQSWSDSGIVLSVNCWSWWRLSGNVMIIW